MSIAITGEGIPLFRLLMLRRGIIVEASGMRMTSKAPSALSIVKRELGLKGNRKKVLSELDRIIAEKKAQLPSDCVTEI